MIRLNLNSGPFWLDLGDGVSLQLKPATTSLMMEARRDPELRDLSDDADDEQVGFVMARVLARRAILDWKGVVDVDGKKLKVSREAIDALLEHYQMFEAF